ncbi:MAG: hypothetical protein ACJ72E_05660 [Marmoricola sp.]
MRRIIITIVIALVAIAGLGAVAAATNHGSSVTAGRLERALPTVFENQYVQQAHLLGHTGVTPASLHAKAMCERGGPNVPDSGPGSDWICLVGWTDPNVPMPPEGYGKFELTVHSNDCFTVGGPSKLVGFQTITDKAGKTVNNPVYEFDGCFDPSSSNTRSGTTYPAVLSLTSTVLPVDASNRTGVQLTCGAGANGCSGTVTVTDGSITLATMPYKLQEQATATLPIPADVPAAAKSLTFAFKPAVGIAPNGTSDVDVQR